MALLKIYNVVASQQLVLNDLSRVAMALPGFTQGDSWAIDYMALAQNTSAGGALPWSRIPPASYSLQIGIYTTAGTVLAYQNTWTPDGTNSIYTGTLTQNSTNVTAALSGVNVGSYVTVYFQIVVTDGSGNVVTALPPTAVKLYKTGVTVGAASIPPGDVSATQAWTSASFVKMDEAAGVKRVRRSANGNAYLEYVDDDGVLRLDPIST